MSELEKEGNKQRVEITKLNKKVGDQLKELEASRAEADSLKSQLAEVKAKGEQDAAMAIRRHKRSTAFRRESDSNYLARLSECRVAIM